MNIDQQLLQNAPQETQMRRESARLRDGVLATATSDTHVGYSRVVPRVRRRRTLVRTLGVAAALAAVATGATFAFDGGSPASAAQVRFVKAGAVPAYDTYGAFSAGNTVYIGNHQVTFDEKIKEMYYTSEGVLVRMGKFAYTGESGPSHYTLIRPNGSHASIDLKMGDRIPATDPNSPNVAYAEPTGDHWSYVVTSLVTGKEVARTEVHGAYTESFLEAPPVTMEGHRMWGLFDAGWMEYDWQSGKTRLVPGTENDSLNMAHGRYAEFNDKQQTEWIIKDFVTGDVVRKIPTTNKDGGSFSPDGRFARFINLQNLMAGKPTPDPVRFVTIDSGKTLNLPGGVDYGWTPGGNAFSVDAKHDRLTVCNPGTGKCDRIKLKIGTGHVKFGAISYES